MLGSYVSSYFERKQLNVVRITRADIDVSNIKIGDLSNWFLLNHKIKAGDVIINCAGLIKQKMTEEDSLKAIKINSVFPHVLSNYCREGFYRLIHISSDCCFSGTAGNYIETDKPDATDIYGVTKAAGEPKDCSVIRTSVIGEGGFKGSLLEWVRSQKTLKGFTNHRWNGVTCLQLAKAMESIIMNQDYWDGVRHYGGEIVNKAQLVRNIVKVYGNGIMVTDAEADTAVDRTLGTIYQNIFAAPPPIYTQLEEQRDFKL
jgi:dTDP-4-dehydrorhamnose reductase